MAGQLTDAEKVRQQARLDRELRAAAQAMEADVRRVVNQLREELRKSMKTLLGEE